MIARWGWPTLLWVSVVLALACWLLPPLWPRLIGGVIALGLWVFVIAFFRNPRRVPQGDDWALVAPADGVVADITEVEDERFLNEPCLRIGIFLSVFDVHVNRIPVASTVVGSDYQPGAFRDARDPSAGAVNEAHTLCLEMAPAVAAGQRYALRQIAGLIARRIVCPVRVGDEFARGALYGMIRFGSRTELWLPLSCAHRCEVSVGSRVRGGETVLLRLERSAKESGSEPEPTAEPAS